MSTSLSDEEVRLILSLRGSGSSAQAVGEVFDVSAETVRRIWRGETHRAVFGETGARKRGMPKGGWPSAPAPIDASLKRLQREIEGDSDSNDLPLPPGAEGFLKGEEK